jgi:hypothetical protein
MNGTTWRERALAAARGFYERDVIDGTPAGNQVIGVEIIGGATGHADPAYRNGKTAWCGYFAQCCFRAAGFNPALEVASAGKALEVYGRYRSDALAGAAAWALDTRTGAIEKIVDLHRRLGALRLVAKTPTPVMPGDVLLHCDDDGSWHGHVMMVWSAGTDSRVVTVIEGNSTRTLGPDGRQRDGVGMRVLSMTDPYLDYVVRPSDLDFDPAYRYFARHSQAEAAWKKLAVEGAPHG